jgi:hypothetical protein
MSGDTKNVESILITKIYRTKIDELIANYVNELHADMHATKVKAGDVKLHISNNKLSHATIEAEV